MEFQYDETLEGEGVAISDTTSDIIGETEMQIREASDRLRSMPELQSENWQSLDTSQRLETLQNVESSMAEIQGRPVLPVIATEMPLNTYGQFDGEKIQINASTIGGNEMPVGEFVDTIVHEGRHAYQYYAIDHPDFIQDSTLVQNWAENLEPGNYLSPNEYGQELYANQPVEADAWNYASRIISGMESR